MLKHLLYHTAINIKYIFLKAILIKVKTIQHFILRIIWHLNAWLIFFLFKDPLKQFGLFATYFSNVSFIFVFPK